MSETGGVPSELKSAFITHSVFVLLNVAIVLTGIFLPRIINQPRIVVEAVTTFFDEEEYRVDDDTLFGVRALGIENGVTFSCANHFRYGVIPSHCIAEIKSESGVQVTQLAARIEGLRDDVDYYQEIQFFSAEKLLEELSSDRIKARENSTLLSAVLLDGYAKPELKGFYLQQLTRIVQSSVLNQIRTREKELRAVKDLIDGLASVKANSLERSGGLEVEIIISNQGYADAIASSTGTMSLGGTDIPLISLSKNQYAEDEKGSYSIIPIKNVVRLFYVVDYGAVSENAREVLERSIASKTAIEYTMVIEVGDRKISTTGNFSTKTQSLDYD